MLIHVKLLEWFLARSTQYCKSYYCCLNGEFIDFLNYKDFGDNLGGLIIRNFNWEINIGSLSK